MSDWHVAYRISDGKKRGASALLKNFPDPMTDGYAIKSFLGGGRLDQGTVWNQSTLEYDPIPTNRKLSIADFFQRFTEDEMQDYSEADSTNLRKVRRVIEDRKTAQMTIDLDSPRTVRMLNILVSESIITTERKAEILA